LKFKRENLEKATRAGFMTATDLADYLVRKGIPFRQAHAIVGEVVGACVAQGRELTDLSVDELQHFSPKIGPDVAPLLTAAGSVNSRQSVGGTALTQVRAALARAEETLGL